MSNTIFTVSKSGKPLGAAFSHARKVAAKTGGGKKKQREVANRYLRGKGEKAIGKSEAEAFDVLGDYLSKADGHTPPQGVQSACKRGLDLVADHGGDGLTEGAKARARSMASGGAVSMANIKRMKAYFARHTETKTANPPSPGYVAWLLWGGDAGKAWASKMADDGDTQKSLHTQDSDMNACDVLNEYLSKGGEGSRGGKVIGYTRSNRPIYQATKARYGGTGGLTDKEKARHAIDKHPDYTAGDHDDAAKKHMSEFERRGESRLNTDTASGVGSFSQYARHKDAADIHSAAASHMRSGSVPGKVSIRVASTANHTDLKHSMTASADSLDHGDACDVLSAYTAGAELSKAGGEGSRGGHIIGHTNGHPIYAAGHASYKGVKAIGDAITGPNGTKKVKENVKAVMAAHPHFTAEDHNNAFIAHHNDSSHDKNVDAGVAHFHAAKGTFAKKTRKSMDATDWTACDVLGAYTAGGELSKAGGAGSRGGTVLRTTASGKAIYAHKQHTDAAYAHFSAQDHKEAAEAHHAEMKRHDDKASNIITDNHDAKIAERASTRHENIGDGHKFKANALRNEERSTKKSMDAGFGDNAQQFADENNMDPNMIQVRAVDDLNNSALNDAIAAAWPGRPYMGNSAASFCAMANNMNYKTGV